MERSAIDPAARRRLRVLQLVGAKAPGGAETYFVRFCKALAGRAEVMAGVRRSSWIAQRLAGSEVAVRELGFGGALDLVTPWRIRALVRASRPDIVQTWMSRASAAIPHGLFVPVVARLGGYYPLKHYARADRLVANTADIAAWLVAHGASADRVLHIPNFAAPAEPVPAGTRERIRAELGVSEAATLVLAAGRLHPNKAFDVAIRAVATLPADMHCVIIGEGPLRADLSALASALGVAGRIHLPGWQDRLAPWIAAADLWLVPSREEPLGNTVLDAWAWGLPLVAADATGPRALVRDGIDGLLVAREDAAAMAAALARLVADRRLAAALVDAGRRRVADEFGEGPILDRWLALYRDLVDAA